MLFNFSNKVVIFHVIDLDALMKIFVFFVFSDEQSCISMFL